MRKVWSENTAKNYLYGVSGLSIDGKNIFVKNGLNGLTACGAVDYLKNHCGYRLFL